MRRRRLHCTRPDLRHPAITNCPCAVRATLLPCHQPLVSQCKPNATPLPFPPPFPERSNGKIDASELRTILTRLGLFAPRGAHTKASLDAIVETIFASADANSDGHVCFDEFIKVFGAAHHHYI